MKPGRRSWAHRRVSAQKIWKHVNARLDSDTAPDAFASSPEGLDEIIAKPFWNITKLEYSLHTSLAEHLARGEWHKFTESYQQKFFLDAFR